MRPRSVQHNAQFKGRLACGSVTCQQNMSLLLRAPYFGGSFVAKSMEAEFRVVTADHLCQLGGEGCPDRVLADREDCGRGKCLGSPRDNLLPHEYSALSPSKGNLCPQGPHEHRERQMREDQNVYEPCSNPAALNVDFAKGVVR
jgi:hypothetical protein